MVSRWARLAIRVLGVGWLVAALYVAAVFSVGPVVDHLGATDDAETVDGQIESIRYYQTADSGYYSSASFTVETTYSYTVDGQTYTGSTVWSDGSSQFDDERTAQNFVRDHSAGTTVTVQYPAGDPSDPYLQQQSLGALLPASLGALVFALAFAALGVAWIRPTGE